MSHNPFAPYSQLIADASVLVVLGSGMNVCFAEGEFRVLGEWKGKGVEGHPGLIALWEHKGNQVLLALGRRHLYEGYTPKETVALVDAAGLLGVRHLLLTNAAGGLSPLLQKGDLVLHRDYIGTLLGSRRVRGNGREEQNIRTVERMVSASPLAIDCYPALHRAALEKGVAFREGVYAGVIGPSYETRAEIRMLRRMGADLVGMSTVPEVQAAARHSMRVVGFSLVTNTASDTVRVNVAHSEVTEASIVAAVSVRRAIEACVEGWFVDNG